MLKVLHSNFDLNGIETLNYKINWYFLSFFFKNNLTLYSTQEPLDAFEI